jgi:hypothetical protein
MTCGTAAETPQPRSAVPDRRERNGPATNSACQPLNPVKERTQVDSVLRCNTAALEAIDSFLTEERNPLVARFLKIVRKYGTIEEINAKAAKARELHNIKNRLSEMGSPYLEDLIWLEQQRDAGAFVSRQEYTDRVLGPGSTPVEAGPGAVTLEISAVNFFPWLMAEARNAVREREIMPGRYVRVRGMNEAEGDNGDLLAMSAAMQIIGASYVETLDTKGTDGSNVHLGGPETLLGYFGGPGMPNDYPLKWVDEYLYYYTTYGIRQVLNVSPGQLMVGYWLNQLGIDNEFKVSVLYAGHDSAFGVAYTFMMAKLMERADGRTPLAGLNLSNSVNADTIRQIAAVRDVFGYRDKVRLEHHVTETYRHIVTQPYLRRDELVDIAATVANVAAKHEGGDPDDEAARSRPSDILDYFRTKQDLEDSGLLPSMEQNYLDKHRAVQRTADALTRAGLGFVAAEHLHR